MVSSFNEFTLCALSSARVAIVLSHHAQKGVLHYAEVGL